MSRNDADRKIQCRQVGQKRTMELGLETLSDRFHGLLTGEKNKPDSKEMDLGSPVSPLRTQIAATTSSSSSSGSVTEKSGGRGLNQRQSNNSGELSGSSGGSSGGGGGGGSSPTAESVRQGSARFVRTGNILKPSPPPENAPSPALPPDSGKSSRPGHCRSGSTDSFTATRKTGVITGGGSGRSHSGPLFHPTASSGKGNSAPAHSPATGSGTALNSPPCPNGNILPNGNIIPSGKIGKTGISCRSSGRSDVLGSGTGNYGHGSIMRGVMKSGGDTKPDPTVTVTGNIQFAGESVMLKRTMASTDPEELRKTGNEWYKKGHFAEALSLYDRAISMLPENAACRSNRAAALTGLGRLPEAIRECEEAVRLDPSYGRAHQRLASLHIRLGQVEIARRHLSFTGQQPDFGELQKLQVVERHLNRCADARKIGDWKSALREGEAAIAAGADSSSQLFASRTESLLKLHQLVEADSALSNIPKFEPPPPPSKFFGMLGDSYTFFVRAQVEMALGRFENAVSAAESAGQIDPRNMEVSAMLNKVRLVARARARGNDLFNSRKFAEACLAYGEGLQLDPSNPVLYCNRAACRFKLGQWERAIEDCSQALRIQPNYTKALLRRAASYDKLELWADSIRDYEILRKELPGDKEVAEALFHAQVALKKSRGEEVFNMKFGEVEEILNANQFGAAISSPGVSVVHFMVELNQQCQQISPFFDTLCVRYPSVNFLKVDIDSSPAVAKAENVRIVPTFKIYKNGNRVKEMICPSHQVLESSVRHYSL